MTKRIILGLAIAVIAGAALVHPGVSRSEPLSSAMAKSRILSQDNQVMDHLDHLVNRIGSRPVGTANFLSACKWAADCFTEFGLSGSHLEQCGRYEGAFPDGELGAFFRSLYASTPGNDVASGLVPIYNVVADIPGTEFPDEYVIVGAHLDSAPQGPGATDNGAGVAAVMEAARLLSVSNVQPRRTIRFILFGGEEAGLIGSKGYLELHPELAPKISAVFNMDHGANPVSGIDATQPLAADMKQAFAAAMNLDRDLPFTIKDVEYLPAADPNCCATAAGGAGGTSCGGPTASATAGGCSGAPNATTTGGSGCGTTAGAAGGLGCGASAGGATVVKEVTADGDTMIKVMMIPGGPNAGDDVDLSKLDLKALGVSPAQLAAEGKTIRKMVTIGSSDHAPFLAAGIPAFWFAQEADDPIPYPAHSPGDIYDIVKPRYMEHSAEVIALGALGTANLDHMLSRERLTAPAGLADQGKPAGGDTR